MDHYSGGAPNATIGGSERISFFTHPLEKKCSQPLQYRGRSYHLLFPEMGAESQDQRTGYVFFVLCKLPNENKQLTLAVKQGAQLQGLTFVLMGAMLRFSIGLRFNVPFTLGVCTVFQRGIRVAMLMHFFFLNKAGVRWV